MTRLVAGVALLMALITFWGVVLAARNVRRIDLELATIRGFIGLSGR